jgi:hypothetical protein
MCVRFDCDWDAVNLKQSQQAEIEREQKIKQQLEERKKRAAELQEAKRRVCSFNREKKLKKFVQSIIDYC